MASIALKKPSEAFWKPKTITSIFWPKLRSDYFQVSESVLRAREAVQGFPRLQKAFWRPKKVTSSFWPPGVLLFLLHFKKIFKSLNTKYVASW